VVINARLIFVVVDAAMAHSIWRGVGSWLSTKLQIERRTRDSYGSVILRRKLRHKSGDQMKRAREERT
jgi:hypothetical protein